MKAKRKKTSVAMAVREALHRLRNPSEAKLIREFFAAVAGTRPARNEPGTERQQMHAVELWVELPREVRRDDAKAAWEACLDVALPHRWPLIEQARAWEREQRKPR